MSRYAIYLGSFSALALTLAVAVPGCGDECSRAQDCETDQVCYLGTCEAVQSRANSCNSSSDCNVEGSNLFLCDGRRCILRDSVAAPPRDAGPRDGGPDAGVRDGGPGGGMDAQPADTGPRDGGGAGMDANGMDANGMDANGMDAGGPDAMAMDSGVSPGGLLTVAVDGSAQSFSMAPSASYANNTTRIQGTNINGDTIAIVFVGAEGMLGTDLCLDGTNGTDITLTLSGVLYQASLTTPQDCTIGVTAFPLVSGAFIGTFSGDVSNGTGATLPLTNGTFNVTRVQ